MSHPLQTLSLSLSCSHLSSPTGCRGEVVAVDPWQRSRRSSPLSPRWLTSTSFTLLSSQQLQISPEASPDFTCLTDLIRLFLSPHALWCSLTPSLSSSTSGLTGLNILSAHPAQRGERELMHVCVCVTADTRKLRQREFPLTTHLFFLSHTSSRMSLSISLSVCLSVHVSRCLSFHVQPLFLNLHIFFSFTPPCSPLLLSPLFSCILFSLLCYSSPLLLPLLSCSSWVKWDDKADQ